MGREGLLGSDQSSSNDLTFLSGDGPCLSVLRQQSDPIIRKKAAGMEYDAMMPLLYKSFNISKCHKHVGDMRGIKADDIESVKNY